MLTYYLSALQSTSCDVSEGHRYLNSHPHGPVKLCCNCYHIMQ